MLEIFGEDAGGYFNIKCRKCNSFTKNKYLGGDPVVLHFEARCETCNETGIYKILPHSWEGLPYKIEK